VVARSSQSLISRAPWDYLHLLDPLVYEYLKGLPHLPRGEPRFDLIPEPVEAGLDGPKTEARDRLGLDPVASYVGCVGAIDTRKGVDRLLNAFSRGLGANVKLLLVGQHDPAIRKALGGDFAAAVRAGSIVSRDDYVAQRQFADAITSCDVLALPYRAQVGSSGLLVRAAAARRPVVTSNYGWLGECVRRFDLGATCDTSNPDQFAAAIAGALTRSSPLALTERAHRFVKFNTEANFKEVWTRQIRLRAGKSPQSSHLTWAWVMFGETQAWNE